MNLLRSELRHSVYATHFILSFLRFFLRSREGKGQLTSGKEVLSHPPAP